MYRFALYDGTYTAPIKSSVAIEVAVLMRYGKPTYKADVFKSLFVACGGSVTKNKAIQHKLMLRSVTEDGRMVEQMVAGWHPPHDKNSGMLGQSFWPLIGRMRAVGLSPERLEEIYIDGEEGEDIEDGEEGEWEEEE